MYVADEMMEAENDTLQERVAALEQKTLVQADEIVCLRATLADVLRRVTLVEGQLTSVAPVMRQTLLQPSQPSRNGVIRGTVQLMLIILLPLIF